MTDELNNDFAEIPLEDLYEFENPLVPGRTCGSCMLCCTVMHVEELNKPSGVTCSYAVAGSGCTIREHRPQACRRFFCGWRLDPNHRLAVEAEHMRLRPADLDALCSRCW